jgi:cold shock CspA family protein
VREAHARNNGEYMKGTVKSVDTTGYGIIEAEDGSRLAFLFTDVLSHRMVEVGKRVMFSIRRVQENVFAQNISYETTRVGRSRRLVDSSKQSAGTCIEA